MSGGGAVVTLYGRPGCHLCDDALLRRYLERIPVVALDGVELYDFAVDEADLAARLGGGGGGPGGSVE